jgi:hypothetical protein
MDSGVRVSPHHCLAIGCRDRVNPGNPFCWSHRREIPRALWHGLSRVEPRGILDLPPSLEVLRDLDLLARAIELLAAEERRPEANPYRGWAEEVRLAILTEPAPPG